MKLLSLVVFVCSAVYRLKVEGQREAIHFHDPTALAMAALWAACPDTRPMLDSFLEAGGFLQFCGC